MVLGDLAIANSALFPSLSVREGLSMMWRSTRCIGVPKIAFFSYSDFYRFHICILYITTKQLFEFKYEKYVTKEKIAPQLQLQLLVTSQSNYLKIHNFDLSLTVKDIMCVFKKNGIFDII